MPFVGVTISRATFRRQIFRADQKAEGGQEGSGGGWGGKRIAREPPGNMAGEKQPYPRPEAAVEHERRHECQRDLRPALR